MPTHLPLCSAGNLIFAIPGSPLSRHWYTASSPKKTSVTLAPTISTLSPALCWSTPILELVETSYPALWSSTSGWTLNWPMQWPMKMPPPSLWAASPRFWLSIPLLDPIARPTMRSSNVSKVVSGLSLNSLTPQAIPCSIKFAAHIT